MAALTIIGNILARPDRVDQVRAALEKLVAPTRAEPGCRQYDLHQDNDNPAFFLFYEIWDSRALWQDHMASAHVKAFGAATQGALDKVWINEMTHIA